MVKNESSAAPKSSSTLRLDVGRKKLKIENQVLAVCLLNLVMSLVLIYLKVRIG